MATSGLLFSVQGTPQQQARDQEFRPLLFALTPAENPAMGTPRSATMQRGGESLSAQRRSVTMTSGSVHTEQAFQATPPPMLRLGDDVDMEDAPGTAGRQFGTVVSPNYTQPRAVQQAPTFTAPSGVTDYDDVWVTVFGFEYKHLQAILDAFGRNGDVVNWGQFGNPQANYIHIQYTNKFSAQRALQRNGEEVVPGLVVGVKPLDARHRRQISQYNEANPPEPLQTTQPPVIAERRYKLQHSAASQQMPLTQRSWVSKAFEFVIGA